ncbi:lipase member H-A [Papilio machaon]|uniref:lipase member H-A n=1 Tax=Papilio machaon TaxID=76193 RepID=UPI0006EAD923|nr:lipase member H-A [Papilio machaon]
MLLTVLYILLFLVTSDVTSMQSSKALEGYPAGLLGDCPGSSKQAIITKKALKYLSFYVQGPGNIFNARHVKYTYFQMHQLARDKDIDFKKKTLLYVGGFLDSPNFPIASSLAAVYHELNYNVLLLDTNTFTTMEYPMAVRFMRPVGKHVAKMLAVLVEEGLDPKKLEVVGLSLGAQTMSYVAKAFQEITGKNISRLTGLDPSGPCFRNLGPEERLDMSDADFVDVVKTNIDGFGLAAPTGHVNFYVNGGEYQPGDVLWMPCNVMCSHVRSFTLWIAALKYPDRFIAIQCDSVQQARNRECYDRRPLVTNILGLNVDKTKEGIFYLATDNNYPYYLGEKGLKSENDFVLKTVKMINQEAVIKM